MSLPGRSWMPPRRPAAPATEALDAPPRRAACGALPGPPALCPERPSAAPGQTPTAGSRAVGSGPRYQILSHVFSRCASQKTHGHARNACVSDSCNVQKSVTQIIYLGPLPNIVQCNSMCGLKFVVQSFGVYCLTSIFGLSHQKMKIFSTRKSFQVCNSTIHILFSRLFLV